MGFEAAAASANAAPISRQKKKLQSALPWPLGAAYCCGTGGEDPLIPQSIETRSGSLALLADLTLRRGIFVTERFLCQS